MNDIDAFLSLVGDVPAITDVSIVRRRSRDMSSSTSPIMRRAIANKFADLIVTPRDKADVLTIARAAARSRMPLMMRGAGTCNFGQGVPLKGGAIVDMTNLAEVLWVRNGCVRAQAGARMAAIDDFTRPSGFELRIHPSTRRVSTIAGFIAGGHAGMGSPTYGILRDRGNIVALEVVSVEEEPQIVELRGDDVNLVHHAYGTNGIITEVEMPLAYAWPWMEVVTNFPDFMTAARFAYELANADGMLKKVITVDAWPNWSFMAAMRPYGRDGWSQVRSMVAEPSLEAYRALVASFGGETTVEAREGAGPYRAPLWEFAWGHAMLQIHKTQPDMVWNSGLYVDPDALAAVERSYHRFAPLGMHFEIKRYHGRVSFHGSPMYEYASEEQIAGIIRGMIDDGAMVANDHTFLGRRNGMIEALAGDAAFKRRMDPFGVMNPGKSASDELDADELQSAGTTLPATGFDYARLLPSSTRSMSP
jgi:FAD/FMN-containing dehydrogenase